ncbi:hypothetical protein F5882DRAFT_159163 [Hyaloscypha sp. PMI_1271]|nr:hypothetical protein F5882DRAFT_159163 [Hyaloscypha sp. PMI_1271]
MFGWLVMEFGLDWEASLLEIWELGLIARTESIVLSLGRTNQETERTGRVSKLGREQDVACGFVTLRMREGKKLLRQVCRTGLRSGSSESNSASSWSRMLVDLRIKQDTAEGVGDRACVIWPGCCPTLVRCWGLTPHLSLNGKVFSGHLRNDKVTGVVLPRPFDRMLPRRGACFLCPDSCDWEMREPNYIEQGLYSSGEVLTSRSNLATTSATRN